jgi:hypothetical protein
MRFEPVLASGLLRECIGFGTWIADCGGKGGRQTWVFRMGRVLRQCWTDWYTYIHTHTLLFLLFPLFFPSSIYIYTSIPTLTYINVSAIFKRNYSRLHDIRNIHSNHAYLPPQHHNQNQDGHVALLVPIHITHVVPLLGLRSPQRPPRSRQLRGETPRNKCARGFLHDGRDVAGQAKAG